jgi:hypothetical protein
MLVLLVRCVRGLAQVGSAGISSRIRGCVVGGSQLVNAIMRHNPVSDARHVRCFFFHTVRYLFARLLVRTKVKSRQAHRSGRSFRLKCRTYF